MVKATKMRNEILKFIRLRNGGVSFVELENNIPGFKGLESEQDLLTGYTDKNIYFWHGLSETANAVLASKEFCQRVKMRPTGVLTYLVDGKCLTFPIAKSSKKYKKPHWLPVVFDLV